MPSDNFSIPMPNLVMLGRGGYPESYSKGSERLRVEARQSPMAQGYRRGQNSTQHAAIHPIHNRSNNVKCGGYTSEVQQFRRMTGPTSGSPSSKQGIGQQRVSQPSVNLPGVTIPIPTKMPWNK